MGSADDLHVIAIAARTVAAAGVWAVVIYGLRTFGTLIGRRNGWID